MAINTSGDIQKKSVTTELSFPSSVNTLFSSLPTLNVFSITVNDAVLNKILRFKITYNVDKVVETAAVTPVIPADASAEYIASAYNSFYTSLCLPIIAKINKDMSIGKGVKSSWDIDTKTIKIVGTSECVFVSAVFEDITTRDISYDIINDQFKTDDNKIFDVYKILPDDTDFNALPDNGTFSIEGKCPNSPDPSVVQNKWIVTTYSDGAYKLQTCWGLRNWKNSKYADDFPIRFARRYDGANWAEWKQIITDVVALKEEIDAAKADIDFSNTNLYKPLEINKDFNTITANGIYFVTGQCPNSPSPTANWVWSVENLEASSEYLVQRVSSHMTLQMWQRVKMSGAWSGYTEVTKKVTLAYGIS